jgi:hypothetical protein
MLVKINVFCKTVCVPSLCFSTLHQFPYTNKLHATGNRLCITESHMFYLINVFIKFLANRPTLNSRKAKKY